MPKINLGIIFGGNSSEHEVSRVSAQAIAENLNSEKYDLFLIGITKKGKWILFTGKMSDISSGAWENDGGNKSAFISPDSSICGLVVKDGSSCKTINLDVVIPVLHGKNGEDGTVQGLLELAGIPYVGCDVASSAACMDKVITNTMLSYNGIKKPEFYWFYSWDFQKNPDLLLKETEKSIGGYPMFVKPANAGSSVGVSKVSNREELFNAVKTAAREDEKILVERGVIGQEVECAILGNHEPLASIPGEIVPSNDFYDYEAKYLSNSSNLYIPAHIAKETSEEIQKVALNSYKIMGCKGLARIDFFVEEQTNKVFLNEINTFPGFTSISMYPKLIENMGIGFGELIDKLIDLALEKTK